MTCCICLEKCNSNTYFKCRVCENRIHKSCLIRWYKENNTCPLCRSFLKINSFSHFKKIENKIYKYHLNIEQKYSITFNKLKIDNPYEQLINQLPYCWKESNLSKNNLMPFYRLKLNNNTIYIDSYLRTVIINLKILPENLILNKDDLGIEYYTTNQLLYNLCKEHYLICVDWIYELILCLRENYKFEDHISFLTARRHADLGLLQLKV